MILVRVGNLLYQQEGQNLYRIYTETGTMVAAITVPLLSQNYSLDKKMLDYMAKTLNSLYMQQIVNLADRRDISKHLVQWRFEGNKAIFRNSMGEVIAAVLVERQGMVENHIMSIIRMLLDLRWYGAKRSASGQKADASGLQGEGQQQSKKSIPRCYVKR